MSEIRHKMKDDPPDVTFVLSLLDFATAAVEFQQACDEYRYQECLSCSSGFWFTSWQNNVRVGQFPKVRCQGHSLSLYSLWYVGWYDDAHLFVVRITLRLQTAHSQQDCEYLPCVHNLFAVFEGISTRNFSESFISILAIFDIFLLTRSSSPFFCCCSEKQATHRADY